MITPHPNKELDLKMGRAYEERFLHRRHTQAQKAHETTLSITDHQEDTSERQRGHLALLGRRLSSDREHHVLPRASALWEGAERRRRGQQPGGSSEGTELPPGPAIPLLGALSGTESRGQKGSLYKWVHSR